MSVDGYDEFVQGYADLCRKTGYCFQVTNSNELGIFMNEAFPDLDDQLKVLCGEIDEEEVRRDQDRYE